jgi:hypothetical protein
VDGAEDVVGQLGVALAVLADLINQLRKPGINFIKQYHDNSNGNFKPIKPFKP